MALACVGLVTATVGVECDEKNLSKDCGNEEFCRQEVKSMLTCFSFLHSHQCFLFCVVGRGQLENGVRIIKQNGRTLWGRKGQALET